MSRQEKKNHVWARDARGYIYSSARTWRSETKCGWWYWQVSGRLGDPHGWARTLAKAKLAVERALRKKP